ncbi:17102_t:CDS:2, partial [Racocetra persica]
LPLFAVVSLVSCRHWCLVVAGVLSSLDFSGVLVNLRVSLAFLWNSFVFFSGVLISGYMRFFTVDL